MFETIPTLLSVIVTVDPDYYANNVCAMTIVLCVSTKNTSTVYLVYHSLAKFLSYKSDGIDMKCSLEVIKSRRLCLMFLMWTFMSATLASATTDQRFTTEQRKSQLQSL